MRGERTAGTFWLFLTHSYIHPPTAGWVGCVDHESWQATVSLQENKEQTLFPPVDSRVSEMYHLMGQQLQGWAWGFLSYLCAPAGSSAPGWGLGLAKHL